MTINLEPTNAGISATTTISLSEVITRLEALLRSPNNTSVGQQSQKKWTRGELHAVIRQVEGELFPLIWMDDYKDYSFTGNERDYLLPFFFEEIKRVEEIILGGGRPVLVQEYRHIRNPVENRIHFNNLHYNGNTMRIYYRWKQQVYPSTEVSPVTTSAMTSTSTSFTVSNPYSFPVPGHLKIENEIMRYTRIGSDGLYNLTRGMFGTVAASHDSGKTIDPVLVGPVEFPHVLLLGCELYAHVLNLQNRSNDGISLTLTNHKLLYEAYIRGKAGLLVSEPSTVTVHSPFKRRRRPLLI